LTAEAIEAKVMFHLNDKSWYAVRKSLFENIKDERDVVEN
jgi:hypothetical protein